MGNIMPNLKKEETRDKHQLKAKYGMRGNGAGADRRPVAVRTDAGLPKRLVQR